MSLFRLVSTYDEAALVALTSKGTVLRARKDLGAGRVVIASREADAAVVTVAGATVRLGGGALGDVSCDCSATGPCRHIVAAILGLADALAAPSGDAGTGTSPAEPPGRTTFGLDAIRAFAGRDWPLALDLVSRAEVLHADPDSTRRVVFEADGISVAIPAGLDLAGALFKGPKATWQRRAVAAAALALAQHGGQELPEHVDAGPGVHAAPDVLDAAEHALIQASLALATGTLSVARNHLFSVAISTRAGAVPRLAAQLRGVARQLEADALRDADLTPVRLFARLAQGHALVRALRRAPGDPRLVGTPNRSYVPSGDKRLGYLGAETWQAPSGARGFTVLFLDRQDGQVYRAVTSRGAGVDLRFDPQSCWGTPLWGLQRPDGLAARGILLENAPVAPDGSLARSQTARFDGTGFDVLAQGPQLVSDWTALPAAADAQLGRGLRRRAGEAYLLLRPAHVSDICFDEIDQRRLSFWSDGEGRVVPVALPALAPRGEELWSLNRHGIRAALVAMDAAGGRALRLITLWIDGQQYNIARDPLPGPDMEDRRHEAVRSATPVGAPGMGMETETGAEAARSPLSLLLERCLEAVLYGLPGAVGLPAALRREIDHLGLRTLAGLDDAWSGAQAPSEGMALAYALVCAGELQEAGRVFRQQGPGRRPG